MAGAGAESTIETQKLCDSMALAGADVLLVVTPHFYKNAMNSAALIKHFTKVYHQYDTLIYPQIFFSNFGR